MKKIMLLLLVMLCLCGCSNKDINGEAKTSEDKEANILHDGYYMASVDNSVQVIRFNEDSAVEWIDCGFGRSTDKRTKHYGVYEMDGKKLLITLSGEDEKTCVIRDEGENITIDGNEYKRCNEADLSEETIKEFD